MTQRAYRKPPWVARTIGGRMAARFNPPIQRLSVQGRSTGRWQTVSVAVLEHEGQRYLVGAFGDTDWSRNLRATRHGRLEKRGHTEDVTAIEVPVTERAGLLDAYLQNFSKMPTVARTFRALPDPAQHPIFRIISATTPQPR
jgi:deazaflavin-dependent oxidoreductase (nitroreductase family)